MKVLPTITLMCAAAIVWLTAAGSTNTYYVDARNGDDRNPGTSWSEAKATINAALTLAADGDTVSVAEGHYPERITLPANVTLLGGFPSGGGTRDPLVHETIIDGQHGGTVITPFPNSDNLVDGFTIKGGLANQDGGI